MGLWNTLDTVSTQIQVEWIWVERHQHESHLKADSLAKKGITSESTYWPKRNVLSTRGTLSKVASSEAASIKQKKASAFINNSSKQSACSAPSTCTFCMEEMSESQISIQCDYC